MEIIASVASAERRQIANRQYHRPQREKRDFCGDHYQHVGYGVTIFLISNPIGWGTAIVLAVGSVAVSYGLGKSVRYLYGTHGKEIDLVEGTGIDRICQ